MRVHLDVGKCQGHGQCNMSAPDIFRFDEQGFAVLDHEEVPVGREQAILLAEQRCPERAISTSA